ncbi:MAG: hypothetical protein GBAus27B_000106 [Mycoplasmataceae bacterium]|nr:MAG: hypothetical protein GBAus27B_000106 [Mycoplasmataceae bacterium]
MEGEIQELKNQDSSTQTPEQQAEQQRKIKDKERQIKNLKNGKDNDHSLKPEQKIFPIKAVVGGGIFIFLLLVLTSMTFLRTKNRLLKRN